MPTNPYLNCGYPGCTRGRCVGKQHCTKHLMTPFFTQKEVNAYQRGRKAGALMLLGQLLSGQNIDYIGATARHRDNKITITSLVVRNEEERKKALAWLAGNPDVTLENEDALRVASVEELTEYDRFTP